jgi:hypothetical protein
LEGRLQPARVIEEQPAIAARVIEEQPAEAGLAG